MVNKTWLDFIKVCFDVPIYFLIRPKPIVRTQLIETRYGTTTITNYKKA